MVTLWRRMRSAVGGIGDTEWALLAFEILGVVGGVFLAFQLGSWVDGRKEASEQAALVQRLFEEAQDIVGETRAISKRMVAAETAQAAIIDGWIKEGRCPAPGEWAELGSLGRFGAINPPDTAYREMLGSGGLSRLPSGGMRRAVSAYHAEAEGFAEQQGLIAEQTIAVAGDFIRLLPIGYDSDSSAAIAAKGDYAIACNDPSMRRQAAYVLRVKQSLSRWREHMLARAINMCLELGQATATHCMPSMGGALDRDDMALLHEYPVD